MTKKTKHIPIKFIIPTTKLVECIMGHLCNEQTYLIFGCSKCQRIEYEEMKSNVMNVGTEKDIYELWQ